jgi:membrane fusion protein (multidrug efflux system)
MSAQPVLNYIGEKQYTISKELKKNASYTNNNTMKNLNSLAIASSLIVILFPSCRQPQMEVTTDIEVPVGVIDVSTADIEEYINTTGTVYAMKEATLNSEISGKYRLQVNPATGRTYAIGDRVKQGATIIRLEDEEYYNGLRLKSKEVDYEISKQEYQKQQSLYEKGGATLRELKNAEINLINTEYDIEASKINLAKMSVTALFTGVISDLPYFTDGSQIPNGT